MERDKYKDECNQRRIQIQRDRENMYRNLAATLSKQTVEAVEYVVRCSLNDIEELFAWREWANKILYGNLGCQHSDYNSGVDSDKRSWIEDRLRAPDERLLKRVSELEREILELRGVIRRGN